jgi:hypothetical protein
LCARVPVRYRGYAPFVGIDAEGRINVGKPIAGIGLGGA